jgi:hypothetical protein
MPELFELTDLASLMQSDLDTATATLARKLATGAIKAQTGQTLDLVTDDVVTIRTPGGSGNALGFPLWLPQLPVVNVTVVVEPAWFGSTPVTLTAGTDYERIGDVIYKRRQWAPVATVTYTHGYASTAVVHDGVRDVALRLSMALYGNPERITGEETEGYRVTYALSKMTDDDRAQLSNVFGLVGIA